MRHLGKIILISLLIAPIALEAAVFINWRAGYHIEYPDEWYHVSYQTVNIFLASQNVNRSEFVYDAVIAKQSDAPFFKVPYIFLIFQPVGQLDDAQIDSVLQSISEEYSTEYVERSLKTGKTKFMLSRPVYDASLKAVATRSRVTSEFTDKMLLEIKKFYEKGIAIFLCFAPKEMYNDAEPIFISILNSFSTKDLEEVAPKDSAKIVDLSERELSTYDESDFPEPGEEKGMSDRTKQTIFLFVLAIIAFGLVRLFIIRKK